MARKVASPKVLSRKRRPKGSNAGNGLQEEQAGWSRSVMWKMILTIAICSVLVFLLVCIRLRRHLDSLQDRQWPAAFQSLRGRQPATRAPAPGPAPQEADLLPRQPGPAATPPPPRHAAAKPLPVATSPLPRPRPQRVAPPARAGGPVALPLPPAPAAPLQRPGGAVACDPLRPLLGRERHPGKFLGEFADEPSRVTYPPEQAMLRCLELEACAGITCDLEERTCSPRKGSPYLHGSPDGEVSYTRACTGAPPDEGGRPQGRGGEPRDAARGGGRALLPGPSAASLAGGGPEAKVLAPGRVVVVVIAHDREDLLQICLEALLRQKDVQDVSLAVSLDDRKSFPKMDAVVKKVGGEARIAVWHKPEVWHHAKESVQAQSVSKISEHFNFALREAFDTGGFQFAVFLETDLKVAPDFLWYFRSTAWLLEEDPSLFCVSAWNDNGFQELVADERRLFRTDYFPGLGWMIQKGTWQEIKGKWPRWPSTGWDHWIRRGAGLRPRECVAPEVSRTFHFDEKGTNVKKASPLARMLKRMATSKLPPGQLGDVSYLLKHEYEPRLKELIGSAKLVEKEKVSNSLPTGHTYMVPYTREDYGELAKKLDIFPSIPRTARRGVIITFAPWSHDVFLLVDRREGADVLPAAQAMRPHPDRLVAAAGPGESCADFCRSRGMQCRAGELEFVNTCEEMRKVFPCREGCGHQVGDEIPCHVHDAKRDTAFQCLVADGGTGAKCEARNAATTRLCACVPV